MIIEEDLYLEHYGIKGQKWGVRQQRRLDTAKKVASGKGTFADKAALKLTNSTVSNIRAKNTKDLARRTQLSLEARKRRMTSGRATILDVLDKIGLVRINTLPGPKDWAKSNAPSNVKLHEQFMRESKFKKLEDMSPKLQKYNQDIIDGKISAP